VRRTTKIYGMDGLTRSDWTLDRGAERRGSTSRWAKNAELWSEEVLGFRLEGAQKELVKEGANRLILNCSRQWGKSTVTGVKALHMAMFREKTLVVVVSPSLRQSQEFVKKTEDLLWRLQMKPRRDGGNRASLVFPNGSRIVGLPGTEGTIRGYSAASLVVVDEAALVKDEQYIAVMPMLATTDGDLWVMSTPRGKTGFFYDIWENGGEEWKKVCVTAEECPRISEGFLAKQRKDMGLAWFRREYMCQFTDLDDTLFDRDMLMGAVKETVRPLWS
jgi:hypothetical protein